LKPVLDRINKNWPRLRDYRNWVIAHPYSINNTNFIVPPWKLLEEEIAPNFVAEKYVLLECARYSIVTIIVCFYEKFKLISSTFDYSEAQKPNTSKGAKNSADAEFERRKIIEELNLGMKQLGIDASGLSPSLGLKAHCPPSRFLLRKKRADANVSARLSYGQRRVSLVRYTQC
jgi:hypothetical protein